MKLTSNAAWLTGCRASGDLLNLLLFVVISRHFGPAGVGAYSYGFAVATFVFVIGCLGIEEFGLRQYARIEPQRQKSFFAELLGAQLTMLAIAVAGLAVYLGLTDPTRETFLIITLFTLFQAAVAVARTLFIPAMSHQHMAHPAFSDLAARVIAFGFAAAAVQFGHASLPVALVGFPVSALLLVFLAGRSATRHGSPIRVAISRATLSGIAAVLWSFAILEIFAQLLSRIGVIALSLQVGDAAAGIFATGLRLVEVALMPLAFLGVAAYPRLSQLYTFDLPAFRRGSLQLMWLMVLVTATAAWGLSFVAPALLVPVLGSRFAGMQPQIAAMALVASVQGLEIALGRLLYASDRQVPRVSTITGGALLNTLLCVVLVPRAGVYGAIYASAASYAVIDIAYALALRRPVTAALLLRVLLSFAVGAAAGIAAASMFGPRVHFSWVPAATCAVVFLAVLCIAYWYGTHTLLRRADVARR